MRKYTDKHKDGALLFTGIISLFAMLFFIFTDTDGFKPETGIIPFSLGYGFIYCIAYLLTFTALSCGPFTLSMLIISYCLVIPIIYGIVWLNEDITAQKCIGLLLLAISLYFSQGSKSDDSHKISLKWVISITLVSVGNGLLLVLQKMQQIRFENKQNHEFMAIALAVSTILLFFVGIIYDRKNIKDIVKDGLPYAGLAGLSNGANNLITLIINNKFPISVVAPLSSGVKVVISFLFSTFLFKEHFNQQHIMSVALGIVALVFLNL